MREGATFKGLDRAGTFVNQALLRHKDEDEPVNGAVIALCPTPARICPDAVLDSRWAQ